MIEITAEIRAFIDKAAADVELAEDEFSFEKRKFILSPLGTALTATISRAANLRRS